MQRSSGKDTHSQTLISGNEEDTYTYFHTLQELIKKFLIENEDESESKVFYSKMEGDYYRYLSEVKKDKDRQGVYLIMHA